MRVITYNLHKGVGPKRTDILAEAVHAAAELAPDLLLCQEVFHGVERALHQSHFITEIVGHAHVFGPNAFYPRGCHGNATFARFAISQHRNVDVTESFFEKRGILHTTLSGDHRDLEVLNVHFSLTGRQRSRQWHKLQQCLPDPDPDVPVLVAGDFNDWGGGLDRRVRRSGLLANALWKLERPRRATFPARRPFLAMDRVYYRGLELRDVRVLTGDPWRRLSDHLPVVVDFAPLVALP